MPCALHESMQTILHPLSIDQSYHGLDPLSILDLLYPMVKQLQTYLEHINQLFDALSTHPQHKQLIIENLTMYQQLKDNLTPSPFNISVK